MTVSSTTSRVEYAGNGSTVAFSVPFYFLANGDLKVYKAGTLQTITTHYTVSGAGVGAGGTVTFVTAPTAGQDVVIFRDPALTQGVDYVANDPFPAASHEQALDRLTMIAQRLSSRLDRAAVLPDDDTSGASAELPSPSAGKALLWNAAGDGLENSTDDFNDIVTDAAAAAAAAASAQSAAEAARDATLAAYDSFDDRYLGAKSSNPSVDNDGNVLVAGALYFNSTAGEMRLYTGSAWVAAYVSAEGLLSADNNLSDLASAPTALNNLGGTTVGKAVFTAATVAAAQQEMDVEVGVDVQAYDADTAKTDVAQTFTASQRGTITTDNDLSFDLSATNNFSCTPTGSGTLTFTNHTAGQSGFILLDNSGGYAISAAATTKINSADLSAISAAGVYLLSYFDNGTNAYIVVSRSFA